jgi:hypothetical protein
MATLSKLIYYPLLILFFLGKLFPYIDILLVIFALTNIFSQTKLRVNNKYLLLFAVIATISNILNFNLISWLYLVRLLSIISLILFPPQFNKNQNKFINIIFISTVIFGFIQYFIWPDLTAMTSQNWDPHLYRLVGTYFDPTFTGLILLFILISTYLSHSKYKKILLPIIYIALALTYSRSSLLSFVVAFAYISYVQKSKKLFLYVMIIFLSTLFILPRMPGEGTKLERTSSILAKIQNYQQGLAIFTANPIIGIGYNNIPKLNYKNNPSSHSNSGFDSSLLTIAITTGIFGLFSLIFGIKYEFNNGKLLYKLALLAIFFHSFFANSLFYPYTALLLIILKSKSQKLSRFSS